MLPPLAWYAHAAELARETDFAIMQPFTFARNIGMWMQGPFLKDLRRHFSHGQMSPLPKQLLQTFLAERTRFGLPPWTTLELSRLGPMTLHS